MTAEQLAPLLLPDLTPEQLEEERQRPGAPLREEWVLPALLQFGGEPQVTDDGDLVYVFPDLMLTAADDAAATGSSLAMGAAPGSLALAGGKPPVLCGLGGCGG